MIRIYVQNRREHLQTLYSDYVPRRGDEISYYDKDGNEKTYRVGDVNYDFAEDGDLSFVSIYV